MFLFCCNTCLEYINVDSFIIYTRELENKKDLMGDREMFVCCWTACLYMLIPKGKSGKIV